ncbi:MAG: hypothetical protein ABL985_05940 [Casimicrobium sp.]
MSTAKAVASGANVASTKVALPGGLEQFDLLLDNWNTELVPVASVNAPTEYWQRQVSEAVIGYRSSSKNALNSMLDAARFLRAGLLAAAQIGMVKLAFFELAGIKPTYAYRLLFALRTYEKANQDQQDFLGTLAANAITEILWAPEGTLQQALDVVNREGGTATAKLIRRVAAEVRASEKPAGGLITEIAGEALDAVNAARAAEAKLATALEEVDAARSKLAATELSLKEMSGDNDALRADLAEAESRAAEVIRTANARTEKNKALSSEDAKRLQSIRDEISASEKKLDLLKLAMRKQQTDVATIHEFAEAARVFVAAVPRTDLEDAIEPFTADQLVELTGALRKANRHAVDLLSLVVAK